MSGEERTPAGEQWRVGRRNGHTVYRQRGPEPRGMEHEDHDDSLGYFRFPADAAHAVAAVNALGSSPPAGNTTTETVRERRVAGTHPDGNPRFHDDDLIRRFGLDVFLAHLKADGYTDLRVESRTVSTTRTESPWEEEQ